MPMLPFTDGLTRTTHFDDEMRQLADRHYSRGKVGTRQFSPNGRKLVLRDTPGTVLFVWMFNVDDYERWDKQRGFYCQMFRNESSRRSSDIILEAEQAAFDKWGPNRCYTYVDPIKIRSSNPGYCFKAAGWRFVSVTTNGKHLLSKYDNLAREVIDGRDATLSSVEGEVRVLDRAQGAPTWREALATVPLGGERPEDVIARNRGR